MLVNSWVTPSIKFGATHLYTKVERGPVTGLQSRPLNPEWCALVIRTYTVPPTAPPKFERQESNFNKTTNRGVITMETF